MNEPDLKWNQQMRDLIREMIHDRNSLAENINLSSDKIKKYEVRYRKILNVAKDEYEYEPPSPYYKDGYNLYRRLDEFMENHLLFLYNKQVPTTNNLAERLLRIVKRKQKQVMSFRNFDSLTYLCKGLGMIASMRATEHNLYKNVSTYLSRETP